MRKVLSYYFAGLENMYVPRRALNSSSGGHTIMTTLFTTVPQYLGLPFAGHGKWTIYNHTNMLAVGYEDEGRGKVARALRSLNDGPVATDGQLRQVSQPWFVKYYLQWLNRAIHIENLCPCLQCPVKIARLLRVDICLIVQFELTTDIPPTKMPCR